MLAVGSDGWIKVVVDENKCPCVVFGFLCRLSKCFVKGETVECKPQCDISLVFKVKVLQGFESLFIFGWNFDLLLTEMAIMLTVKNILELATRRVVWVWRRWWACIIGLWRRWQACIVGFLIGIFSLFMWLVRLMIIGAITHRFGHIGVVIHSLEAWYKGYWSKYLVWLPL